MNGHQDLISRFTLDSATEFLFGSRVNSLDSVLPYPHNAPAHLKNRPLSDADRFANAFREAQVAISHRARLTWLWPWFELFSDRTERQMRVVDEYLKPILERALAKAQDTKEHVVASDEGQTDVNESHDEGTLLDHLIRFTQGEQQRPILIQ